MTQAGIVSYGKNFLMHESWFVAHIIYFYDYKAIDAMQLTFRNIISYISIVMNT